jgi:hypothetical protein
MNISQEIFKIMIIPQLLFHDRKFVGHEPLGAFFFFLRIYYWQNSQGIDFI